MSEQDGMFQPAVVAIKRENGCTLFGALPWGLKDYEKTEKKNGEFCLLLIRPSLASIFDQPKEPKLCKNAIGLMTSKDIYETPNISEHDLETIHILYISEGGTIGLVPTMRLDILLWLYDLSISSRPPIDYPEGLFTNRDVMLIASGLYKTRLFYKNPDDALYSMEKVVHVPYSPKIVYSCTVVDEDTRANLRGMEKSSQLMLLKNNPAGEKSIKLPSDVNDDWQSNFLSWFFNHAKEKCATPDKE